VFCERAEAQELMGGEEKMGMMKRKIGASPQTCHKKRARKNLKVLHFRHTHCAMAFSSDDAVGYLACLIAVVFFGSNFVPVKKVPTADGMFFTLIMTSAVLLEGFVVQMWRGNPRFEPFAMLGGALW
jgi:hypothetical protein